MIVRRQGTERNDFSRTFLDLFRDEYLRIEREQMERESPTVQELKRIRSEIWHIGHNINQIARLTNAENSEPHTRTQQSSMRMLTGATNLLLVWTISCPRERRA